MAQRIVILVTLIILIAWFLIGNFGGVSFDTSSGLSGKRINGIKISEQIQKQFLYNKSKGLNQENERLLLKLLNQSDRNQENMDYVLDIKTWTIYGEKIG